MTATPSTVMGARRTVRCPPVVTESSSRAKAVVIVPMVQPIWMTTPPMGVNAKPARRTTTTATVTMTTTAGDDGGDDDDDDDGGDGEYRMFIANQADPANTGHLTLIGSADSAVVDAGTLTTTLTHANGTQTVIGNISNGSKVQSVTVVTSTVTVCTFLF